MYNISDNTRSLAAELAEKIIAGDQPGAWLPYLQPADAEDGFVTDPDSLFAASPQALISGGCLASGCAEDLNLLCKKTAEMCRCCDFLFRHCSCAKQLKNRAQPAT